MQKLAMLPAGLLSSGKGPAIELRNLTVRFGVGSDHPVLAVDRVSLTLAPGEFVSLVGPSGCGKTTILNLLTGLLAEHPEGEYSVLGKPPIAGNPDIAYMLARDSLLPWRTTLGNAAYGMEIRNVPKVARGIGRGCAHTLADRGHAVALVDVLETEMARTKAEIEAKGVACLTFAADVSDHGRAKAIVDTVAQQWGRIDVLVNNAGRSQAKGILELTEAEWDAMGNLKSCFNYIQAFVPQMRKNSSGRIVSMASENRKADHTGGGRIWPASRLSTEEMSARSRT
jgi:ABC-type sugar transport system ATPase subunit